LAGRRQQEQALGGIFGGKKGALTGAARGGVAAIYEVKKH
jgi:hypothetical protein